MTNEKCSLWYGKSETSWQAEGLDSCYTRHLAGWERSWDI